MLTSAWRDQNRNLLIQKDISAWSERVSIGREYMEKQMNNIPDRGATINRGKDAGPHLTYSETVLEFINNNHLSSHMVFKGQESGRVFPGRFVDEGFS